MVEVQTAAALCVTPDYGFREGFHAGDLGGGSDAVAKVEDVAGVRGHTGEEFLGGGSYGLGVSVEKGGVEVALYGKTGGESVFGFREV